MIENDASKTLQKAIKAFTYNLQYNMAILYWKYGVEALKNCMFQINIIK